MAAAADAATDAFRSAVRPVYGVSKRGQPEHLGSSVLIEVDDRKLILTAAHIIDENHSTGLYVGGSETLEPLEAEFHATNAPGGDRSRDHYDFAFAELSTGQVERLGSVRFVSQAEVLPAGADLVTCLFTAVGYPNSRNKLVDTGAKKVMGQLYQYSSVHRFDPSLALRLGISDSDHLFIDHQKRARDETGRQVSPIGPHGLSGGAIVEATETTSAFFQGERPFCPKLAGIVIERHAGTLLGTRIDTIIAAIRGARARGD